MRDRLLSRVWLGSVALLAVALLGLTFAPGFTLAEHLTGPAGFAAVLGLAFLAEYVDSSLGMGYGTTLTPLLLILGFSPLEVVPAVLLSEFLSGAAAGLMHHRVGNADLRPGRPAFSAAAILAACSVVGAVFAVGVAVNLPGPFLRVYIGLMVLGVGLYVLFGRGRRGPSTRRLVALGTVAAFNKGISGGGYGPLVTGGQLVVGVKEREAVAVTSLAEGVACLVGLGLYLAMGRPMAVHLLAALALGAVLSVPLAAVTVRALPSRMLRRSIGYATVFLGLLTLVKA